MITPAVVVCGCGRSGTNVMLEVLRGNPVFSATEPEEDKVVFSPSRMIQEGYLSKCDTVYFDASMVMAKMRDNPHLRLIWMVRDPRDMIMSKMRRGVPESLGGDCKGYASDSTASGAIDDIQDSLKKVSYLRPNWTGRIKVVRMEDILENPEKEARAICEWLEVDFCEDMPQYWTRMRNKHKAKRYNKNDKGQIALWKKWKEYENGWFIDKMDTLISAFDKVAPIANYLGYEDGSI